MNTKLIRKYRFPIGSYCVLIIFLCASYFPCCYSSFIAIFCADVGHHNLSLQNPSPGGKNIQSTNPDNVDKEDQIVWGRNTHTHIHTHRENIIKKPHREKEPRVKISLNH